MNITHQQMKDILAEYETRDTEEYDDEMLALMDRVDNLPTPDKLMLFLYAELASERKLADALGLSRGTIRKALKKIKEALK